MSLIPGLSESTTTVRQKEALHNVFTLADSKQTPHSPKSTDLKWFVDDHHYRFVLQKLFLYGVVLYTITRRP